MYFNIIESHLNIVNALKRLKIDLAWGQGPSWTVEPVEKKNKKKNKKKKSLKHFLRWGR
jgi:hypothetical protein